MRAYVSIKSVAIYFGGEDAIPFIEIVAVNSGQSPALHFIWSPTVVYLADVEENPTYDPGEEWMSQPGVDISPNGEEEEMYFPTDFALVEQVSKHREMPTHLGVSVTIEFGWIDVFSNQILDMASFAGIAEMGDAERNKRRHALNTSKWRCDRVWPIRKGELWTGVAVRAPTDQEEEKEPIHRNSRWTAAMLDRVAAAIVG